MRFDFQKYISQAVALCLALALFSVSNACASEKFVESLPSARALAIEFDTGATPWKIPAQQSVASKIKRGINTYLQSVT